MFGWATLEATAIQEIMSVLIHVQHVRTFGILDLMIPESLITKQRWITSWTSLLKNKFILLDTLWEQLNFW